MGSFAAALGTLAAVVENRVLPRSEITALLVPTLADGGMGDPNAVNFGVGGAWWTETVWGRGARDAKGDAEIGVEKAGWLIRLVVDTGTDVTLPAKLAPTADAKRELEGAGDPKPAPTSSQLALKLISGRSGLLVAEAPCLGVDDVLARTPVATFPMSSSRSVRSAGGSVAKRS